MHDIRLIRENPDAFDAALFRRNIEPSAAAILELDGRRRQLQAEIQDMQSRRNQASKEIGMRKSKGEDADGLIAEVNDIKSRMPSLEEEGGVAAELDTYLMGLPNILDPDVPDGADEADNSLLRSWGRYPGFRSRRATMWRSAKVLARWISPSRPSWPARVSSFFVASWQAGAGARRLYAGHPYHRIRVSGDPCRPTWSTAPP